MNNEQIDRLLDEGLKNYSRVEAPEGFSERVSERIRATAPQPARWPLFAPGAGAWRWVWVPAAAAVLLALWIAVPRPVDYPTPPVPRAVIPVADLSPPAPSQPEKLGAPPFGASSAAGFAAEGPQRVGRPRVIAPPERRDRVHVLSPEELARMRLPAEVFPKEPPPAELSIRDLTIPELKIPALEGETAESGSAETT